MWFEDLPEECPPVEAAPNGESESYYRLVSKMPVTEDDFIPLGREHPNRANCGTLSLSIMDRLDRAEQLLKLPRQRGKLIACLDLPEEAGVLLRTGRRAGHYSWWRRQDFNAVAVAREVA